MTNIQKKLDSVKYFGLRKIYFIIKEAYGRINDRLVDAGLVMPEAQQSLIKYSINKKLVEEFSGDEGHNINRTQYFPGFGLLHYAFIRNLKPSSVLCIGSRMGFIPAILALACKDNKFGHVDFVDAGYDEHEPAKHWSGVGFWKKKNPGKHFGSLGVSRYITSHIMTTKKYETHNAYKRYEYIYIDGDHSYHGVKEDYQLFWPKLKSGGYMLFHDIVAHGYIDKGLFGIWKFWRELEHKHTISFPFPKDSGLGIIQKNT